MGVWAGTSSRKTSRAGAILPALLMLLTGSVMGQGTSPGGHHAISLADTTVRYWVSPPSDALLAERKTFEPDRYKPIGSMIFSMLLPGGGQLYCRQYVQAGMFLTMNIVSPLVAVNRAGNYRDWNATASAWEDSVSRYRSIFLQSSVVPLPATTKWTQYEDAVAEYRIRRYRRRRAQYVKYQSFGWASGLYLWNVLDALESSNFFYDGEPRSPSAAAWLSAIPVLGLGQIYNGAFAKAGLIWTTHAMLGYMAYNYNRLMKDALWEHGRLGTDRLLNEFGPDWDSEYVRAFRRRNTFLWYVVMFYFYGIFDAAVDAHLHDYDAKMRINPDVDPQARAVGMEVHFTLKRSPATVRARGWRFAGVTQR